MATDNTGKFCVYTNTKASIVFDRVAATDLIKGGEPFRRLDSRDRWEDEQEHEHTQEDESTDDSASASPSASASTASWAGAAGLEP